MMRISSWRIARSPHSFRSLNMSRLPLRTVDDAPDAAKNGLELAQNANGFLPNLVRLLANAPVALETYQTVSGINSRGGTRLAEAKAVPITTSVTPDCC